MLKKLYKYEFLNLLKVIIPVYIIMGIVVLGHLITSIFINNADETLLAEGSFLFSAFFSLFVMGTVFVAVIACAVVYFYNVIRFYTHLFSNQGYLTFTLPVKPMAHYWVKMIVLFASSLATLILVALAVICVTGFYGFDMIAFVFEQTLNQNLTELFILIMTSVIGFISSTFVVYACICIGQKQKNKILSAFLIYAIYYAVKQFIGVIFVLVTSNVVFTTMLGNSSSSSYDMTMNYQGNAASLWVLFVIDIAFAVASYFISRKIINKQLNLE